MQPKKNNILIIYSTTDGHTLKISQKIQSVFEASEHRVKIIPIDQTFDMDLTPFDKIVLGASIRYGNHHPQVFDFIRRNHKALIQTPSSFFSVNIVARKENKNKPENNPYLLKFLNKIDWTPALVDVFAGKLDYPKYRPIDRLIIRLIMYITKGPTNPQTVIEFTDWGRVEAFSKRVLDL